jgi:hypothetical protein
MQPNHDLIRRFQWMYDMFNSGEVGAIDDLVSREAGSLGIGTDPQEWWMGDQLTRAFRSQPAEMHLSGLRLEPGELQAYSEGSVGWIADRPTLTRADGRAVPLRLTAVCHQENETWKMVQFHMSIGLENAKALGAELTI